MQRTPRAKKATAVRRTAEPIQKNLAELEQEFGELTQQIAVASTRARDHEKQKPAPGSDRKVFIEWHTQNIAMSEKMISLLQRMAECNAALIDIKMKKIAAKSIEMEIADLERESNELRSQFKVASEELENFAKQTPPLSDHKALMEWMSQNQSRMNKFSTLFKKLSQVDQKLMEKRRQQVTSAIKTLPV